LEVQVVARTGDGLALWNEPGSFELEALSTETVLFLIEIVPAGDNA
jgi:hypothetical protein